ncbi:acyltransferase family protein [Thermomonas paludicola]|uniref:acyltransferase family protein n=1 Tax=Thermomonas paludicola TaxID=2884874 RepID=UPI0021142274|nr:acyltransferase family protein [Thermomonas paludicola]
MSFRPDIEGLRAIAILLVVAAHAGVPWLAGGYVGVDVFFVLSGYLITRLLTQELLRTRRIQFMRFYARRFRRLLPALLLMLVVTGLLGSQLVPASQQSGQANAGATAVLWASNLLFAFSRLDYFGVDSSTNLYLHTWSLGVEEQYYLVWPLLLAAAYGTWRKAVPPSRLNLVQLLWLVAGLSFAACIFITNVEPRHAFYLMPLRAWQFALGGLAGLYFADRDEDAGSIPPRVALFGWLGLVGIVASAVILGRDVRYPGAWAILPTLGALAVLVSGTLTPRTSVSRMLAQPAMTAIGRVSYSWYLWHWPMLVLGSLFWPQPSPSVRLILVLASLLLAWLSWRFVETPIRQNARLLQPPRRAILGALLLMACAVAAFSQWQIMVRRTIEQPAYQRILSARGDLPSLYRMQCDQWYRSDALMPCEFGNPQASQTLVVLGDSVGLQWFPAIQRIFDSAKWRIVVMTKSACPIVDMPMFYARIGREYTECANWREAALTRIAQLAPNRVILGSTQTYDFTDIQWLEGTIHVLRRIAPGAGRVDILRASPELPFDGPNCMAPRGLLWNYIARTSCAAPAHDPHSNAVFHALQVAASGFNNVQVIDMTDAICPGGTCVAERDGIPTYRDELHLTAGFAASLAPALAAKLKR